MYVLFSYKVLRVEVDNEVQARLLRSWMLNDENVGIFPEKSKKTTQNY